MTDNSTMCSNVTHVALMTDSTMCSNATHIFKTSCIRLVVSNLHSNETHDNVHVYVKRCNSCMRTISKQTPTVDFTAIYLKQTTFILKCAEDHTTAKSISILRPGER